MREYCAGNASFGCETEELNPRNKTKTSPVFNVPNSLARVQSGGEDRPAIFMSRSKLRT